MVYFIKHLIFNFKIHGNIQSIFIVNQNYKSIFIVLVKDNFFNYYIS